MGVRELWTYKLEQEGVFPQRSDATGKAQDEHDPSRHQEEPDGVKAPQVCDGRDVGENTLERQRQRQTDRDVLTVSTVRIVCFATLPDTRAVQGKD